jgi:hypothetical protein
MRTKRGDPSERELRRSYPLLGGYIGQCFNDLSIVLPVLEKLDDQWLCTAYPAWGAVTHIPLEPAHVSAHITR